MSEFVTVARPYAKAAFDFAVEHNSVERWQDMLAFAAEVTKNDQMAELLSGALAPETLSEAFIAICGEQLDENGQNLIKGGGRKIIVLRCSRTFLSNSFTCARPVRPSQR